MERGSVGAMGVVLALLAGAVTGCGDDTGAAADLPRADQQYDGPLYVDRGRDGPATEGAYVGQPREVEACR